MLGAAEWVCHVLDVDRSRAGDFQFPVGNLGVFPRIQLAGVIDQSVVVRAAGVLGGLAQIVGRNVLVLQGSVAYFEVFAFLAAVELLLVWFVLTMRRSVAERGAHIGAE